MEKVDGLNQGNSPSPMDRWEKAINENKTKREDRPGIMDRGQRATKPETENKAGKLGTGDYECKTCSERRYVDQSDDPSVSFQTPTKISAGQSAAAVMGHEREHVANEDAKAKRENREVISSSVTLHYAICPECGKSYVAGGETRTTTKAADKQDKQGQNAEMLMPNNGDGKNIDVKA